jgi:hypothetical protein
LSEDHVVVHEARESTVPETRPTSACLTYAEERRRIEEEEVDLDSLWTILSQTSEIDLAERHLAGKKLLRKLDLMQLSDDQLEISARADCISMEWATEVAGLNAISRAWQAGVSADERADWGITAEMLFMRRFDQDMGYVRHMYEDVEERAEAEGLTLAEQFVF